MIVKCEQCQTRFKIPDEKVTDKGVKVRCTKCGHTFRVTRESAADATGVPTGVPSLPAPGAPGAGFDPFEQFGTAPEPKGHTTRPGFVPEAVEASRLPVPPPAAALPPAPWNFTDSGTEEEVHHEPTRVMPLPVPVEARPPVPSLPPVGGFDFDAPQAPPAPVRGATPAPGQGFAPRGGTPTPGQGFAPRGGTPTPGQGFAPRGSTPVPGQGISGPRPSPNVAPVAAKGPAAPGAAKKPPSGSMPRPAALGSSAPASAAKPGAKPATPAPAAGDLFAEFFTPGAPAVPLPDLPPPTMSAIPGDPGPVPLPAPPSAPQTPAYAMPFGGGDSAAFGSVDMDLSEPPPDLGPPPEFGAAPDFDAPAPTPAAAPPPPPRPLAPPAPAPLAAKGPPTPLPLGGKPKAGAAAPASRMAPPAMAPPAYAPPAAAAPAPVSSAGPMAFGDEDPFGSSGVDLSAPAPEFDPVPPGPEFAPLPMPAPADPGAPMPFADEDPFGSSGVDLTVPPPAAAPMAAPPAPAPVPTSFGDDFAPPGPMDFGMIGDEQMGLEAQPAAAAPSPMPDPFAPPEPAGGAGMPDPFAAPAQQPGGFDDPFAAPAQQPGGFDDPFAAPAQQPGGFDDPFAAPAQQPGGDPFAAPAQQPGGMNDPFAHAEPAFSPTATGRQMIGTADPGQGFLTQTDTSHQTISPTETGRHMLDFPPRDTGMQAPGEEPGQGPPTRELIDVPAPAEAPPPSQPSGPNLASPSIARPVGRPADMGIPERRKLTTAQAVTGQVAYLTIAAGLLLAMAAVGGVYMKEGRVDASALSPKQLIKLVTPSDFVVHDVSNGLYDTRGGNSVFYVKGEVENRTSKPVRVKVNAALYDGASREKSAEGLAGGVPTPEELYAVNTSEAAEQLRAKLDAAATSVAPGAKAPFTLVFQDLPRQLSDLRLKITTEPAAEETAKP